MIGNVWEWTTDWFVPKHPADAPKACCVPENPRGPREDQSYDPFLLKVGLPGAKEGLQARDVTLAQLLKAQGYATALGADIEPADVIAPDDKDVGLLGGRLLCKC